MWRSASCATHCDAWRELFANLFTAKEKPGAMPCPCACHTGGGKTIPLLKLELLSHGFAQRPCRFSGLLDEAASLRIPGLGYLLWGSKSN
jgi:hypothetical protein